MRYQALVSSILFFFYFFLLCSVSCHIIITEITIDEKNIEDDPNKPENDEPDYDNSNKKNMAEHVYYVEAFHGGFILSGAQTYGGLDLVFDALEEYPRYKVSFEIEASTWDNLNKTYLDKIRAYINSGRIEICMTSYDQPFLGNLTKEYVFWQLKKAKDTIEQVFNITPQVYVCQEPAIRPDMPELLNKLGIYKIYGRISWPFFGNMRSWELGDVMDQDLVIWKYKNYNLTMIPNYASLESAEWEFFDTKYFLDKVADTNIHHPFQSTIFDFGNCTYRPRINQEEWIVESPNIFPSWHSDSYNKINDSLTVYTSFNEYIEKIADTPKDIIEIPEEKFDLDLVDKQQRYNETHTRCYDGTLYDIARFQYLWNKTKELEYIWLGIYGNNISDPLIDELGYKMSVLFHHDIWACYHLSGWGLAYEEGFEDWYAFWLYYYQLTIDYLSSHGIIIV